MLFGLGLGFCCFVVWVRFRQSLSMKHQLRPRLQPRLGQRVQVLDEGILILARKRRRHHCTDRMVLIDDESLHMAP
jgi:hypothetical protein